MHHVNEAHRLIHLFNIGPTALANAAGAAKSTAAAWREGRKKPGTDEARAAIELRLRVPREAWDMAPGRFATEGELQVWLLTNPACRRHDHTQRCVACEAYEARPTPAPHGLVSLAELAAVAGGGLQAAPSPRNDRH